MRKNFLFSLAVLMASFFVFSCSKEDGSSKEAEKKSEIVKEENSKEEETPNQGNSNSSDNNTNQGNNPTENNSDSENNSLFVYKVLVEDITGSWCVYCPRVSYAIERIKKVSHISERVVPVAIHSGGGYGYYEPMVIEQATPIYNYYRRATGDLELTGLPYFAKNRKQRLYVSNVLDNIDAHLKENKTSPIGIKISSSLADNGGKVSVSFKFRENYDNLKYTVYVIEDKLIYEQRNATQYYGGERVLSNFEHNDVLRGIYSEAIGNSLGAVKKGEEVTKNDLQVNYNLLSAGKLSNVKVVVFVSDATTGEVLNVQEAKANETKNYQYAQ